MAKNKVKFGKKKPMSLADVESMGKNKGFIKKYLPLILVVIGFLFSVFFNLVVNLLQIFNLI